MWPNVLFSATRAINKKLYGSLLSWSEVQPPIMRKSNKTAHPDVLLKLNCVGGFFHELKKNNLYSNWNDTQSILILGNFTNNFFSKSKGIQYNNLFLNSNKKHWVSHIVLSRWKSKNKKGKLKCGLCFPMLMLTLIKL